MAISDENGEPEDLALKLAELNVIALRCANRPILWQLSDDQILGYDERGIPPDPSSPTPLRLTLSPPIR